MQPAFEVSRVILPLCFTCVSSVWCLILPLHLLCRIIKPRPGCKCMQPAMCVCVCVCTYTTVWKPSFLTVPVLACGGDNSQVHLYVQSDGEVSSGRYSVRGELSHVYNTLICITNVREQHLTFFNCSTTAQESHVTARTWRLGTWSGLGISG